MNGTTRLAAYVALALVLAGCYPKYITDVGESADYPLSAAGFERRSIIRHTWFSQDVSVYYDFCKDTDAEFKDIWAILRTRRISGPDDTLQARLEAEKAILLEQDPSPEGANQEPITLLKDGRSYAALKWSQVGKGYSACRFRFSRAEGYFELPVPRYIELIVWRHDDRILSLTSYANPENQDIASAKNLELLDAVNWTVLPF